MAINLRDLLEEMRDALIDSRNAFADVRLHGRTLTDERLEMLLAQTNHVILRVDSVIAPVGRR